MTTATRKMPDHGTLSCGKYHRCPCELCKEAIRAYNRNRTRKKAYGTWQPLVDAQPARQHLRALVDAGVSLRRIATLIGGDYGDLGGILYQHKKGTPRNRIRPQLAQQILAIPLDITTPPTFVDATGTRRRLQALIAAGWPQSHLVPRLGRNSGSLWELLNADQVTPATAEKVARVYRKLLLLVPEENGVTTVGAKRSRGYAARRGWVSPAAWDDIDDPNAQPEVEPAAKATPRYIALAEDGLELEQRQGYTRQQAADRLGVKKDYLQASISRYLKTFQEAA